MAPPLRDETYNGSKSSWVGTVGRKPLSNAQPPRSAVASGPVGQAGGPAGLRRLRWLAELVLADLPQAVQQVGSAPDDIIS